jgi:proton-translocating NADH-quinone oxidoreductase, chain L
MSYVIYILLLPLASFVILGLFGKKSFAGIVGTLVLLACTVLSIMAAYEYHEPVTVMKYTWLPFASGLSIDMGIMLDTPAVMMLVVISFISLMVHVFSLGYMKGEARFATYYAFLSLFTFSMLGLVVSTNILQMYIFWELVGVSSFLLIGFYYDRPSAVAAAKKAFIVTRFADLGFLIGILMVAFYSGTLDFATMTERLANTTHDSTLTIALLLIFIGGAGKSAMFPLHIWLPDAMEGPTPVSALIHAATMVVAGVYLVARLFNIYMMDPQVMQVIAWTGAISAALAAIIACTQTDIKRVLAYSTISQIGFMIFAIGLTAYTASLFHLFTHAFFKSLLFLGAGAVIHYIHSNDMHAMGGLRKHMPITHITFLVACLAIAGIPPFAGFFSKEAILLAAWQNNPPIYYIALITSGITAFYMFRLYFSVFWNKQQLSDRHSEGTFSMKLPLLVLAIGAIASGFALKTELHLAFSMAPITLSLGGIFIAWLLYGKENPRPQQLAGSLGALYKTAYRKFYFDEIYLFITKKIIFNLVARPAAWIDKHIVDGAMNALAGGTARLSTAIKGMQSGQVQSYALYFFAGVLALAALFIYLI